MIKDTKAICKIRFGKMRTKGQILQTNSIFISNQHK